MSTTTVAWMRWAAAFSLAVVVSGCLSWDAPADRGGPSGQAEVRRDAGEPLPFLVEGFGAGTRGGTGGVVLTVTNLNDSGPGSLRHAVERSGPRIVRFAVSGTIELKSNLEIHNPFLTIDGSDAPEGGIALRSASVVVTTEHVILRHIRIRPGRGVPDLGNGDAVTIKPNAHHIVLDHLSLSWSTDETVSIYGTDVTVQWNFITESLNCAGHPRGCHSKGFFVPGPATRVSVLHNLVAHHVDRNPFIRAELEDAPNDYQYVNNVFYNYHIPTLIETLMPTGTIRIDWVGNFYKRGRNTGDFPAILLASRRLALFRGTLALHLEGNVGPPRDSEAERDAVMMQRDQEHYGRAARHFPPPSSETDAQAAFSAVLERAGATLPCRDVVDQRVATEARAGLGRIINDPLEGGGYPILRCAS